MKNRGNLIIYLIVLLSNVKYDHDITNTFKMPPLITASGKVTPKIMNYVPMSSHTPAGKVALVPTPYAVEFDEYERLDKHWIAK